MRILVICFYFLCITFWGSLSLTAQSIPVAEFLASTTAGCAPLEIEYYDDSEGDVDSYSWTFAGGIPETSTEADPIITYENPGKYLAILTVIGNGETHTDSAYITVRSPRPVPAYRYSNENLTISFENQTPNDIDFQWDFGDGHFSAEANPMHTYAASGTYLVKLRATNDCMAATHVDVVTVNLNHQAPNYTANEQVEPYDGYFRPGVNLGYFPPWNDMTLADIAMGRPELGVKGAGVKSIRPGLFDSFIQQFGWDARVETYEHFDKIGLEDNTLIVGFPSPEHRDTTFYCDEHQSELFADLYTPIWDNGENGTPINDDNDYAVYLYKLVNLKKDYIKFWEIWNEPGFDHSFVTGYLPPGTEGNWWENNPDPCDYKLRAPIFHYVRILRISYEIIKAVDPDAYVTLAAVGYPSFLDAVLRNTDNPDEGNITGEYPLQGGAYFDAIGMHTYPHFDGTLSQWNNDIQDFDYFRHTDKAITSIPETKSSFETVLESYGYNGQTYPEKEWIITEINVPRKQFGNYIGSEEAQINFLMKSFTECVRSGIREMHVFDMAESHYYEEASTEFHMMGFYQRLYSIFPYDQIINNGAMAFKTMSDQLFQATYDESRTAALNLPGGVDGAAFLNLEGNYIYVLWAQTSEDMSEAAVATYSFPSNLNIDELIVHEWDASYSDQSSLMGAQNIELTGTPILLTDLGNTVALPPTPFFSYNIEEYCQSSTVSFTDASTSNTDTWYWEFPGGFPATSTEQHPVVNYNSSGSFEAFLTVNNAEGSASSSEKFIISVVEQSPQASFTYNKFDQLVSFVNNSSNATSYIWDLGDSNVFSDNNPSHSYAVPGYYTITLYAINACDTANSSQDIIILPELLAPRPDYTADRFGGCPGDTIHFQDLSTANTTTWYWLLDGGTPSISTEQNPIVVYDEVGSYEVALIAGNDAGTMTKYRAGFINITEAPTATFSVEVLGKTALISNTSAGGNEFAWNFGDGQTSSDYSPNHFYDQEGEYTISLTVSNYCDTLSISETIVIAGLPVSEFNLAETAFCESATIALSNATNGEIDSLLWLMPGGIPASSTAENITVSYSDKGVYTISLITWNAVGSDTLEQSIYIYDQPVAQFSFTEVDGEYVFTNESEEGIEYSWDFGDGSSSNEISPTHSYDASGQYNVSLTTTNVCGSNTAEQVIDIISSLSTPVADYSLNIYPNPAQQHFTIIGDYLSGEVQLKMLDGLGQIVHQQLLWKQGGKLSHNVYPQGIAPGIYFIKIDNGQHEIIKKLVIQ